MPTRAPVPLALAVTLALTATLGLSACGGDDDATADPPATTATTASTDPSTSPTAEPPPTQAPTGETARQFIYRWFALSRYAQNSGDTATIRALGPRCKACQKFADTIDQLYASDGFIRTDGSTVLQIKAVPSTAGTTVLHVRARVAPTTYSPGAGKPEKHLPGGSGHYEFVLTRSEGWTVSDYFNLV